IVQNEPWLPRDRAMIDPLRSLGIEKGKPFQPDEKTKAALDAGIREAHALLDARYAAGAFPEINPGMHWAMPALAEFVKATSTGYADPNTYPIDSRGLTYTLGYVGIKRLGTAQYYLMSSKDAAGNEYDGNAIYKLTVPANAPVKQYWSVTVY